MLELPKMPELRTACSSLRGLSYLHGAAWYLSSANVDWYDRSRKRPVPLVSTTMAIVNSVVDAEYWARIDAMLPKERIAKSLAMFQWMHEMVGRQILKEVNASGSCPMSDEELKWQQALRMYGEEPAVVAMIKRRLKDVSR